ncbi:hypothetical protein MIR68_007949 [Amoeboaphelidium protococcarum]|nr:hypothetical protein MIR68_007949 [Amoeboaphelidium protococcarum]
MYTDEEKRLMSEKLEKSEAVARKEVEAVQAYENLLVSQILNDDVVAGKYHFPSPDFPLTPGMTCKPPDIPFVIYDNVIKVRQQYPQMSKLRNNKDVTEEEPVPRLPIYQFRKMIKMELPSYRYLRKAIGARSFAYQDNLRNQLNLKYAKQKCCTACRLPVDYYQNQHEYGETVQVHEAVLEMLYNAKDRFSTRNSNNNRNASTMDHSKRKRQAETDNEDGDNEDSWQEEELERYKHNEADVIALDVIADQGVSMFQQCEVKGKLCYPCFYLRIKRGYYRHYQGDKEALAADLKIFGKSLPL